MNAHPGTGDVAGLPSAMAFHPWMAGMSQDGMASAASALALAGAPQNMLGAPMFLGGVNAQDPRLLYSAASKQAQMLAQGMMQGSAGMGQLPGGGVLPNGMSIEGLMNAHALRVASQAMGVPSASSHAMNAVSMPAGTSINTKPASTMMMTPAAAPWLRADVAPSGAEPASTHVSTPVTTRRHDDSPPTVDGKKEEDSGSNSGDRVSTVSGGSSVGSANLATLASLASRCRTNTDKSLETADADDDSNDARIGDGETVEGERIHQ